MRTKFLLFLIGLAAFAVSKTAAQNGRSYTVSLINQVLIDKENGNDIENYAAVFSAKRDSVTVYKWGNDGEEPQRNTFWGEKAQGNDGVTFRSTDGAEIKVIFLKENRIHINSDLYLVNKAYYEFLHQKLVMERSVLDLAFFTKDGYGDYAVDLELLSKKNWRNQKENPNHRIIEVEVKNRNQQTNDQFHNWKAVYTYKVNGMLQRISGEYYTKKLMSSKGNFVQYFIEQNLDRSYIRGFAYHNKKTLMDSVSVNWTQFSTARKFHYTQYQSRLKLVSVDKKPRNFSEIAKLLD